MEVVQNTSERYVLEIEKERSSVLFGAKNLSRWPKPFPVPLLLATWENVFLRSFLFFIISFADFISFPHNTPLLYKYIYLCEIE